MGIRDAGLEFLRDPRATVAKVGLWQNPFRGRVVTFPYAPGFHLPLAASSLPYDDLLTAEKLLGAAVSTLPIAFLFALARQIGASPLGAVLLLTAPTYGRHLAVAFLPALLGHAWDMGFLTWLAPRLERLRQPRVWVKAALFVAACQLAYVSAVTLVPAFLASLALSVLVFGARDAAGTRSPFSASASRGPRSPCSCTTGTFSVPSWRRCGLDPPAFPPVGGSPLEGVVGVVMATTLSAFTPLVLVLAVGGFTMRLWKLEGRVILAAWALAYALLLLGRALLPGLLQFQHEALFVDPLVFLATGEAIAWLAEKGRGGARDR